MAPLLVLLFLLVLPPFGFARVELTPRAELVIGREVPNVRITLPSGESTTLRDFSEGKPVVLSFIYTRCTSSCPVIIQRLSKALDIQREYKVLLIDFDMRDTPKELRKFLKERSISDPRWAVALPSHSALERLSSALDFRFSYDEKTDMFAHPNILVILTPSLKVSSYVLGLSYDRNKIDELLTKADSGELLLNPIKGLLLKCFRYDPVAGTYTVDWSFVAMLIGGALPITGMFYALFLRNLLARIRGAV